MYKKVKMTEIEGIRIGQEQDRDAMTGCTVVLCEDGAVAGCDIRGSAPGTRETELLRPGFLINEIHGILLTGGSAFGLDAAGGVQRFLEARTKGYDARGIRVPIVPAAVIFDLREGSATRRPDAEMAFAACENSKKDILICGLAGAGTGATVGKIAGHEHAMKGGVGYFCESIPSGLKVAVVAVVNALGDVIDPENNKILAGARDQSGKGFVDAAKYMRESALKKPFGPENTTLAVIMTNAKMNKSEVNKVAQMAQNGISRAIRPAHTMYDGDIVFAMSTGTVTSDINLVGDMAAASLARAIVEAVRISNDLDQDSQD